MGAPIDNRLRLVLLLVVTLSTGCSTVQMAYDNSDRVLLRYADSYLDLNSEQKTLLRAGLRQRLEDHRHRELVNYVAYLDALSNAVRTRLTREKVDELAECAQSLYESTIVNTIPVLTPVLAGLGQHQVDHLSSRLNENNRKYRKTYLEGTVEQRQKARAKRTISFVEYWTGDLNLPQRELVAKVSFSWPDLASEWYEYRRERQEGLLVLLREPASESRLEHYLSAWWVDSAGQPPALQQKTHELMHGVKALVLAVDQSLTPKQREHVLKRIQDLRDELDDLLPKRREQLVMADDGLRGDSSTDLLPICSG